MSLCGITKDSADEILFNTVRIADKDVVDFPAGCVLTSENGQLYVNGAFLSGGGGQGPRGLKGETGLQGVQGIQGIQGIQGPTGIQGSVGNSGATGSQGNSGADGGLGVAGLNGLDGSSGSNGKDFDQKDSFFHNWIHKSGNNINVIASSSMTFPNDKTIVLLENADYNLTIDFTSGLSGSKCLLVSYSQHRFNIYGGYLSPYYCKMYELTFVSPTSVVMDEVNINDVRLRSEYMKTVKGKDFNLLNQLQNDWIYDRSTNIVLTSDYNGVFPTNNCFVINEGASGNIFISFTDEPEIGSKCLVINYSTATVVVSTYFTNAMTELTFNGVDFIIEEIIDSFYDLRLSKKYFLFQKGLPGVGSINTSEIFFEPLFSDIAYTITNSSARNIIINNPFLLEGNFALYMIIENMDVGNIYYITILADNVTLNTENDTISLVNNTTYTFRIVNFNSTKRMSLFANTVGIY